MDDETFLDNKLEHLKIDSDAMSEIYGLVIKFVKLNKYDESFVTDKAFEEKSGDLAVDLVRIVKESQKKHWSVDVI